MKIEMFEKVGEIEIVELRSAVENKAIAEIERARKAEEKERKEAELTVKVATWVAEKINEKSEKGETWLEIRFNMGEHRPCTISECKSVEKKVKEIFTSLGYDVRDIYEYSTSWANRSECWGYWDFYWGNA